MNKFSKLTMLVGIVALSSALSKVAFKHIDNTLENWLKEV